MTKRISVITWTEEYGEEYECECGHSIDRHVPAGCGSCDCKKSVQDLAYLAGFQDGIVYGGRSH